MNFGDAITAMREGKKVSRKIWEAQASAPNGFSFMFYVRPTGDWDDFIGAQTNDGRRCVGNITHGAMLADDWYINET